MCASPMRTSGSVRPLAARNLLLSATMISMLLALSGCVGMVADSMAKSMVTGDSYATMTKSLAAPADGCGRLYVYRTEASTHSQIQVGIGLLKNPTLVTVDDTAYELIYEAFEYFDLPQGQHEITCGTDIVKGVDFWTSRRTYQKGTSRITVSIAAGSDVFVRLDSIPEKPSFKPVVVEKEQALAEISKLPYQKKQGHTYGSGKISEGK